MHLQLLLQLYQPLIISRSKSAAALHPDVDVRELTDAAARAVLTAAAKYDRQKAGRNVRLASLAAGYIKTAVRDVLREVTRLTASEGVHTRCQHDIGQYI